MTRDMGRYSKSYVPRVTGYIEPTAAGETISWNSWSDKPTARATWPITLIPYASGGDYSGATTIEQSNYRVLTENEHVMRRSVLVTGAHGTFGLAYIGAPTRRIREICDALDAYPLLDESDHSELELEIESRDWGEWGHDQWKREIADAFDVDLDDLTEKLGSVIVKYGNVEESTTVLDRALDATWWSWRSNGSGDEVVFEAPDSCHFRVDAGVEWLREERVLGPWLVLGDIEYSARSTFSVARDAAIEAMDYEGTERDARLQRAREILALWPDLVLVDLPEDEDEDSK